MSKAGNSETTTSESRKQEGGEISREVVYETPAQQFYRMSGCKTKNEFAKRVNYCESAVRLSMLRSDRPSRKRAGPETLHRWARALSTTGGPNIIIGLWPTGEITLQIDDD